jgi:Ni/Fe-hydrogenase subunit HybB-like protein
MFVTFTTVGAICLLGSLVHCVMARRPDLAEYARRPSPWQWLQRLLAAGYQGTPAQRHRRRKAGFWMSLFMLPALFAPAIALAILFVVRPARSVDVALLEVAAFLAVSFTGGVAFLIVAAALVGWLAGREAGLPSRGTARLGRWLLAAVALSLLLIVAAEIASVGSQEGAVAAYGRALLGPYGGMFWGALGSLFVAAGLLWRAAGRPRGPSGSVLLASLMVGAAVFLHHTWLLVAWQTHGLALPYPTGAYSPTWIECAVVLGIVAVCILALLPAVRLIPFAPVAVESRNRPQRVRGDVRRTLLTSVWLVLGLVVAGIGLAGAARVGTDPSMDPALTGSPVIFMVGLVMLATVGALYELLPEPGPRE